MYIKKNDRDVPGQNNTARCQSQLTQIPFPHVYRDYDTMQRKRDSLIKFGVDAARKLRSQNSPSFTQMEERIALRSNANGSHVHTCKYFGVRNEKEMRKMPTSCRSIKD